MLINDPLSNNIEKKATRDGYGQALADLGEKNSKGTQSGIFHAIAGIFAAAFIDQRFQYAM